MSLTDHPTMTICAENEQSDDDEKMDEEPSPSAAKEEEAPADDEGPQPKVLLDVVSQCTYFKLLSHFSSLNTLLVVRQLISVRI